ncbi:hypothetical protein CPLU01_10567 [Colletotrichum plurivorum]|uniref:Uncharacterized protein n=1 Tax=Colletotrichum plurivorum TaxID=2175906 RepID=A0A8H6K4M0_9PEZI|nr:hypothetical protein CPLU01_10567 [Colletotrichum plurivorum]
MVPAQLRDYLAFEEHTSHGHQTDTSKQAYRRMYGGAQRAWRKPPYSRHAPIGKQCHVVDCKICSGTSDLELLSFRQQIWDIVNKLPYPSKEQLGLDKLPHEIYDEIFSHVVDHYPVGWNEVFLYGQSDAVTIAKVLRLTNRRLHDVATPYLMSRVDVEITKASIERLENIARHPVIGPFIRQIRFRLPVHRQELTTDIRLFARHAWERLGCGNCGRLFGEQWDIEGARLHENIDSWRDVANGRDDPSYHSRHLKPAFIKYCEGFREEMALREDDSFTRRLGSLAKGLPNIERLIIVDRSRSYDDLFTPKKTLEFGVDLGDERSPTPDIKKRTLADDDISRLISAPLSWGVDEKYLKKPRTGDNTRMMNNILTALGSEGVRIRDLFIDVFEPWRFENLRSYPAAERSIGRLTETLEGFRFQVRSHENDWPQREASDLADLRTFTDSLLRSRNLRAISLGLKGLCPWNLKPPERPSWHINMLLTPREWPELRQLTLSHVLIHSSKLGLFLGQRKEEMSLALVKCSVSYGTWREALDVMRDAVPGGLKVVAIRDCAGAEYDHFRKYTWSETHYQGLLFGSAACHLAYGTWNSGPKFTDCMSLCYVTHRTETRQCDPAHPLWKHTDAAENPFRVAKLSEEVRNPFDFEPQF